MQGFRCALLSLLLLFFGGMASAAEVPGRLAPARGMLLVAAEGMRDPRFAGSVVLIIDAGAKGVMGIILNHPTRLTLGEALGSELGLPENRRPIFYGGPVDPSAVTTLLRAETAPRGANRVTETLWLAPVATMAALLQSDMGDGTLRVIAGYAGWAAPQLAAEIARGEWYLLPCDDRLVFETPPGRLWQVLRARGDEVWL